jgi:thiosulfate/3-mercaptopyruvate sulfurtransferase
VLGDTKPLILLAGTGGALYLILAAFIVALATGPRLVTTGWLAEHVADPQLVILHVGRPDTYESHIAGAQRTDLSQLAANATPPMDMSALVVEMLPPDVLRARLESYGISDRSTVVVYAADDNMITTATRVVFTLRVAGLGARVALLDGGLPAWVAERRPVTAVEPQRPPGHITATPARSLVVNADWVQAHLGRPGVVVIDARDQSFYDGVKQGSSRSGHIPTARSLPFTEMYDSTARLKSPAVLKELFRSVGAQPGDTIVAYCHIGVQATAVLFAADQLGHPVKLYDGSFDDWAARKDLPVVGASGNSK